MTQGMAHLLGVRRALVHLDGPRKVGGDVHATARSMADPLVLPERLISCRNPCLKPQACMPLQASCSSLDLMLSQHSRRSFMYWNAIKAPLPTQVPFPCNQPETLSVGLCGARMGSCLRPTPLGQPRRILASVSGAMESMSNSSSLQCSG